MSRPSVDKVNKQAAASPEEVFEAVHTIMHLFRAEQYRALRHTGNELTHFEGKILSFFFRNPGATLSGLVLHTGRDKGQLARLIKSLREQGLLEAQEGGGDRRSVPLRLTAQGRAVHQTLQRQLGRVAKMALEGLGESDRAQLATLLQKLRANLESS